MSEIKRKISETDSGSKQLKKALPQAVAQIFDDFHVWLRTVNILAQEICWNYFHNLWEQKQPTETEISCAFQHPNWETSEDGFWAKSWGLVDKYYSQSQVLNNQSKESSKNISI